LPLGNASKNPHLPEVDVGEPFKGAVFFNAVQSSAKYSTVALALAVLFRLYYFDDVDPDDALPASRQQILDYWTRRQREIIATRSH